MMLVECQGHFSLQYLHMHGWCFRLLHLHHHHLHHLHHVLLHVLIFIFRLAFHGCQAGHCSSLSVQLTRVSWHLNLGVRAHRSRVSWWLSSKSGWCLAWARCACLGPGGRGIHTGPGEPHGRRAYRAPGAAAELPPNWYPGGGHRGGPGARGCVRCCLTP